MESVGVGTSFYYADDWDHLFVYVLSFDGYVLKVLLNEILKISIKKC